MRHDLRSLVKWFLDHRRDLPWRRECTPYAVWVSEVMLQQTRVATVIPYFRHWMESYPTLEALARAPIEQVLKSWEGLGYYRRARNLHTGASYVVAELGGCLPATEEALLQIPGIGSYTASAICAFAYGQAKTAIDGNVLRVMSRYEGIEGDVTTVAIRRRLKERIEENFPEEGAYLASEGLIELGATVCTKRNPSCTQCPLHNGCFAFKNSKQHDLPESRRRVAIQRLHHLVGIVVCNNLLLVRRPVKGGALEELYRLPWVECSEAPLSPASLHSFLAPNLSLSQPTALSPLSHTFTRYRVHLHPYRMRAAYPSEVVDCCWLTAQELSALPFASGHRELVRQYLETIQGGHQS